MAPETGPGFSPPTEKEASGLDGSTTEALANENQEIGFEDSSEPDGVDAFAEEPATDETVDGEQEAEAGNEDEASPEDLEQQKKAFAERNEKLGEQTNLLERNQKELGTLCQEFLSRIDTKSLDPNMAALVETAKAVASLIEQSISANTSSVRNLMQLNSSLLESEVTGKDDLDSMAQAIEPVEQGMENIVASQEKIIAQLKNLLDQNSTPEENNSKPAHSIDSSIPSTTGAEPSREKLADAGDPLEQAYRQEAALVKLQQEYASVGSDDGSRAMSHEDLDQYNAINSIPTDGDFATNARQFFAATGRTEQLKDLPDGPAAAPQLRNMLNKMSDTIKSERFNSREKDSAIEKPQKGDLSDSQANKLYFHRQIIPATEVRFIKKLLGETAPSAENTPPERRQNTEPGSLAGRSQEKPAENKAPIQNGQETVGSTTK